MDHILRKEHIRKRTFPLLAVCLLSFFFVLLAAPFVQQTQAKTEYVINGVKLPLDEEGYRVGDYRGRGACWEFCQHVYEAIWGTAFSQFHGNSEDILKDIPIDDSSRVITAKSAKTFIMQATPGSVVRVQTDPTALDSNSGNRHSFIILEIHGDGCTVYHAWDRYVNIEFLTWSEMESRLHTNTNFGSFKYIKYPH